MALVRAIRPYAQAPAAISSGLLLPARHVEGGARFTRHLGQHSLTGPRLELADEYHSSCASFARPSHPAHLPIARQLSSLTRACTSSVNLDNCCAELPPDGATAQSLAELITGRCCWSRFWLHHGTSTQLAPQARTWALAPLIAGLFRL